MKLLLSIFFMLFLAIQVNAQEQFTSANAASAINEANSVGSLADIRGIGCTTAVETGIVAVGTYSYRGTSVDGANDRVQITPNLENGTDYEMKVYLAEGPGANIQVEVWAGVTSSVPTINPPITTANSTLQEFTITFTTNSANQTLRFYNRGLAGTDIYLDNVSIIPVGSDTEAPTAPGNLASNNTTEISTDLSWDASTDNVGVTDYEVFQDGNSIGLTGGATTFNVTGLTPSTGYAFTVFALDAAGNTSPVSNTENMNTLADTDSPTAPTNLAASNTTGTTTDLSWNASTDNIGVTDYEVFQDGNSIGLTGGATTFNVTGLTPSTGYAFTVFALDGAGNTSPVSNTENVNTLDTEAPTAPGNLASNNTTETSTDLSWDASTDNVGVTDYEVFQDGNSIGLTGGATTFNVTGLTPSTGYAFTVFALDAAGNTSPVSNTENMNTLADTDSPTAPTNLAAGNTTGTTTELSWNASTDNIGVTDYEVFQDGNSIGLTGGATTFNVTGLTPSTGYAFTVFALDGAGNTSPVSNTENVNTLEDDTEAPTAPGNLASNNTTEISTDLSWDASTDNVGVTDYEVFQDGNSIGLTGGATTFNVTGLTPSTGYAFTVFALDAAGNTSPVSNTENMNTLADTDSPTAPTNLAAGNTTDTTTDLSWNASTDNIGVTDYEVFQDGNSIGLTGGATTFNVTGLTPSTGYAFTVFALDGAGNTSPVSNTTNINTSGGATNYTTDNANLITVDWQARDLFADRNVGIGTTDTQGYRLAVAGNVIAESVKVELQVNWPDFVFTKKYGLPSLQEVENHILEYGHLLNIPSAEEVEEKGIDLGLMNAKLLQKIEELTLYTIQQEKKIQRLENENNRVEEILVRLFELEKEIKGDKNKN
ncbi:fibronectin type III domain-containing protein [Allomuricauda sp. R78024]|uniref:fibronectin type III domain-containing protein n=1 Tax=Allomuricauda sp. R78024 TaxID=3093867 RepID=UPI0037C92D8F